MYVVYWFAHIVGCLARRDFRAFDKIFWVIVLLLPLIGLLLYRGLGPEFYKNRPKAD